MSAFDFSLLVLAVLGFLLLVVIRVVARKWGNGAAEGVILGVALLQAGALAAALFGGASTGLTVLVPAAILAWMVAAYVLFLVAARNDDFPDDDFPRSHCAPQLTHGGDIDYRSQQWDGNFNKLAVRFRCRPTHTNLHKSLRARRIAYYGLFFTLKTLIARHDSTILCDSRCNAGANHIVRSPRAAMSCGCSCSSPS